MEIFQLVRSHRGSQDFVKWIGRLTVQRKRTHEAWMDLLPQYNKSSKEYLFDVNARNALNTEPSQHLDPQSDQTLAVWRDERIKRHRNSFPLGDNLYTLIFIVVRELSEAQREILQSTLSMRDYVLRLTRLNR